MILVADRASYGFLGRLWKKGEEAEVPEGTPCPRHFHLKFQPAPVAGPAQETSATDIPVEKPVIQVIKGKKTKK